MGQHTPVVEPPLECTPSETPPWPDNRGSEIRKIMKIQVLNGKSGVSLISLPGFNISLFHCYGVKLTKFDFKHSIIIP